uniref:Putative secreted protein n=1 Tax=Ixodes ricinus TaxID=34613 RepID=A0A6B0U111_IXORI
MIRVVFLMLRFFNLRFPGLFLLYFIRGWVGMPFYFTSSNVSWFLDGSNFNTSLNVHAPGCDHFDNRFP